ncbi:hypothetical protein FSP39_008238 [Pinctada imbricata]|uniref:Protein kinase domain-containing protein n=1 Tax=Pinctada imbricata TaxID=66713 RepID=A0AA88XMU2_PINIB|nr:hypothetical protein FSP39_008238 [Pinctada imbricata]
MSEGSGRYVPLNLSSTSGSGYVYNIPVTSDKYVDANTYLCTGNTTGPFVLESAIHTRSEYTDLHSAEEFVRVFNTVETSKERISMRNHFYRHILPSLTDEKFEKDDETLQQLNLLLTCSDEHISRNAIQEMQNLIFKLDFEKLKVKSVMSALKSVASQLNSLKHDSRDEGVRLLSDLVIVLLIKEKLNPAESKQIKRRLNDLQHSVTSKASKKDKGLDMKSVADFLHYCMKYTMSKEGVKLMESRAENSLSEKYVQELISNVHKISTIEIYLHLLGFLFKVNSSPMPMSIAKSYAKVAHAKLTNLSPSKDKRGEASLTLLADFILRGAIVLFDRKLLSSHTEFAKECLTVAAQIVCSPNSSFATLPCEMVNICSKIDQSNASSIWSNLGLSDVRYQDLVVKLVKRQIPGMIIRDSFNQNIDLIARRSDHSSWITMLGTIMNSSEVAIKLMIPGQHPTKLHIQPREETEFWNIESEFEILKYIQRCQQHTNVAQMVAFYDTNPRSVAMFAVEIYEITLLKYLYDVRSRNDELTLDWKIQRCLEMLNAVDFIHHHDIVHRDIMAASFSIRCQGQDHEIAVLTSFKRAIHNDEEGGTSTIGHVRDLNATQIPTRWTAPESFLQDKFDRKSDIWMFGHVIREVFTYGCQPYTEIYSEDTENIMVKVLCCGLKPYKWRCIPMGIHSLTLKCFENDPGNRPSNQKIYSSLQEFHKKERKDIQNKDANRSMYSYVPHDKSRELCWLKRT